jgi:predicted dehydrogenase
MIGEGLFGDVVHLRVDSIQDKRWQIARSPWYGTAESGRTALTGSGIHEVDLVCWLAGNPVREVFAFGNKLGEMPFHAPTTVTSMFHFVNGTIGLFTICYQAHWPKGKPRINEEFSLIGSRGLVYGPRYIFDGRTEWESFPKADDEHDAVKTGSLACIAAFLGSLEKNAPVPVSGAEALKSLEVAVALNRSVETGEKIIFA